MFPIVTFSQGFVESGEFSIGLFENENFAIATNKELRRSLVKHYKKGAKESLRRQLEFKKKQGLLVELPDDLSLPISTSPEEMAKHVTDVVISDPELGASVEWREAKYSKSPPVRILDKVREPSSDSITFDRGEPIQRLEEHLAGLLIWANRVTVIDQYMLHNLKGAKNFFRFLCDEKWSIDQISIGLGSHFKENGEPYRGNEAKRKMMKAFEKEILPCIPANISVRIGHNGSFPKRYLSFGHHRSERALRFDKGVSVHFETKLVNTGKIENSYIRTPCIIHPIELSPLLSQDGSTRVLQRFDFTEIDRSE